MKKLMRILLNPNSGVNKRVVIFQRIHVTFLKIMKSSQRQMINAHLNTTELVIPRKLIQKLVNVTISLHIAIVIVIPSKFRKNN